MFHSAIIPVRTGRPAGLGPGRGLPVDSAESDGMIRTGVARLRAEALARATPWLSALSIACMATVAGSHTGSAQAHGLIAWVILLVAVNGIMLRRCGRLPDRHFDARSSWSIELANTLAHAGLWAALPLLAGTASSTDALIVPAAALATMMAGGMLLAVAPVAALAWIVLLGAGLTGMLAMCAPPLPVGLLLLAPLLAAAVLTGCRLVERTLHTHLAAATLERVAHESIALLLKEYEDQGVGWLWQIDGANRLAYVSPRLCVLLGRSTSQLIGQSLLIVLGSDARLDAGIAARRPFTAIDVAVATPAGIRCVSLAGSPVIDQGGGYQGFRGVGTDITEARRSQDRLTQLASIDMLTGLPNRQRLREIFADAIEDTRRTGCPCAILFLDLDGFKPVNDTFGHSIGDAVLRIVAQRLNAEVGALGLIGRVGGDEFALMLPDGSDRGHVEAIAHRLIDAIAEPFLFDKGEIRIGISVGCAFAPVDGMSIDDLLLKADLALYEAKSRGRGTFRLFDTRMQHDAEERLELERDLRRALDRGQLRIAYQPIVAAADQAVLGFEALLRWQHPERGEIQPADFIPIAEETRLIGKIGAWVIEQACRDAACWPDQMFVSVNVSARQLLDPSLPNAVGEALAAARLQPNRLELEVTESVFLNDSDGALDVLRRLRMLGIGIALDDFGTGYSSLGYLNKTIFHTLKIDGSFVRDAATKTETHAIIGAIVGLATGFRLQITAEGIETRQDLERMRDFGCHKLQGFLFGKPIWHEQTLELVAGSISNVTPDQVRDGDRNRMPS